MDRDALERARRRIAVAGARTDAAEIDSALRQAKAGLEALARTAAELEAAVPERLGSAIQEGMKAEVLPVARHIAEVRGLSAQIVGRLERLSGDIAAERRARVEDLALLVDLVASGWRGVERRLDRLERIFDRLERSLDESPNAAVYRIDRGA
jgi:hypothetical protein